jgi:hypothetical protein
MSFRVRGSVAISAGNFSLGANAKRQPMAAFMLIIFIKIWCPGRDSNSHEHSSLRPEHSVSTNSTTWAFLTTGYVQYQD